MWLDGLCNCLKPRGLDQFVRESNPPPTFANEEEQCLYQHRFDTTKAKKQNKAAYQILKEHFVDTDAWSWMKPFDSAQDGLGAFLALVKTDYAPNCIY